MVHIVGLVITAVLIVNFISPPVKASDFRPRHDCIFEQTFPSAGNEVDGDTDSNHYVDTLQTQVFMGDPFSFCGDEPPRSGTLGEVKSSLTEDNYLRKVARGLVIECPYQDLAPQVLGDKKARAAMLCLINHDRFLAEIERKARAGTDGIQPLRINRQLRKTSQIYARRMVAEKFFSHIDPNGQPLIVRVRQSGYLNGVYIWLIGENLGWGSGSLGSPARVNSAFLASPAHKKILNDYRFRDLGIGVAPGSPFGGITGGTWALTFGKRTYR